MHWRNFYGAGAAGAAAVAVGLLAGCGAKEQPAAGSGAAAASRPPVILVSLDTCRADRLGVYGGKSGASPFLDRLAAGAAVFTNCLAPSSNTAPSHRSLFTGQYPHRHRHSSASYTRSPYLLPGLLRDAGYETVGFAGGGFLAPELGFAEGFDYYTCKNDEGETPVRRGFSTILPQADRWVRERAAQSGGKPWFLFLHTYDIHCPYYPSEPWRQRFGGWYQGNLNLEGLCGRAAFDEFFSGPQPPSADDVNYLNSMYDAGIAMTDNMLGQYLDLLRELGVLDRALLIVTSDHGESLGERRRYIGHNHMWEEQLQVPLIIRFPNGEFAGTRCAEPVSLVDVLPTALDYLGIGAPPGMHGESLLPVLRGAKSWSGDRLRVSQYQDRVSFRFDERWKVTIRQVQADQANAKLYDLKEDPYERSNLLLHPDPARAREYRAVLDDLLRRFDQWRDATKDGDQSYGGVPVTVDIGTDLAAELTQLGYAGFEEPDQQR